MTTFIVLNIVCFALAVGIIWSLLRSRAKRQEERDARQRKVERLRDKVGRKTPPSSD